MALFLIFILSFDESAAFLGSAVFTGVEDGAGVGPSTSLVSGKASNKSCK